MGQDVSRIHLPQRGEKLMGSFFSHFSAISNNAPLLT
jgi:hypothetical protein